MTPQAAQVQSRARGLHVAGAQRSQCPLAPASVPPLMLLWPLLSKPLRESWGAARVQCSGAFPSRLSNNKGEEEGMKIPSGKHFYNTQHM